MSAPRILIAGIGNIFLGDDAFGVEVVQQLAKRPWPQRVHIADFGIRGLDLAYRLLEEYTTVILVDAVPRGQPPGTLYLIEPDISSARIDGATEMMDAHTMQPEKVLRLAVSMGAKFNRLLLVGCEPTPFNSDEEMQLELTQPVRAAVDEAVKMIESLVLEHHQDERNLAGADATSHGQNTDAGEEFN